jgi:hypothetical protein
LNLSGRHDIKKVNFGKTMPAVILKNNFKSYDEYINNLRSDYRCRFIKITEKFFEVKEIKSSCVEFNHEMYGLYLEVLKKSSGKLETLSYEFFKSLPDSFILSSYYQKNILIGWTITLKFRDKFYFFLGGINYDYNMEFSVYFNLLFKIIKTGIELHSKMIDLGQSAEIAKTRTGGEICNKYLFGFHSNKVFNFLIFLFKGLLEYNRKIPDTNVIKRNI